jgi:tyrosyl-tRNA synthetase
LIHQKTRGIEKALQKKTTIYLGIDLTADSLHIGHLVGLLTAKRAVQFGHRIIILTASGTTMIGDPSGKDQERPILARKIIEKNKKATKRQIEKIFGTKDFLILDNFDWLKPLNFLEFLRDIGKLIPVNSMLDKEAVRTRLERKSGISFAEFSYQLLQAYDFLFLFERYNCLAQIGGSDQWGNIIQGVELVRKKISKQAFGLCFPLVEDPSSGRKFGKTEAGRTVWLDSNKTHPFELYQFFINVSDRLTPVLTRYYSFKSKQEIEKLEQEWQKQKESRLLQKQLAFEIASLAHGSAIAKKVKKISEILFEKSKDDLNKSDLEFIKTSLPYLAIKRSRKIDLEQMVFELGLEASKSAARRLVLQNGARAEKLFNNFFLVSKGKRDYGIIELV